MMMLWDVSRGLGPREGEELLLLKEKGGGEVGTFSC